MKAGHRYLKMLESGMSHQQIADRCGVTLASVYGRLTAARKEIGISSAKQAEKAQKPKRQKLTAKNSGFAQADLEDREIRERDAAQVIIRPDGVKQCPPRYCYGYGINGSALV